MAYGSNYTEIYNYLTIVMSFDTDQIFFQGGGPEAFCGLCWLCSLGVIPDTIASEQTWKSTADTVLPLYSH